MEVYALDILLTMLDDEKEGETKGWQSFFRKKVQLVPFYQIS